MSLSALEERSRTGEISLLKSTMLQSGQGWAGIPVPVHSQEWKPLIPFPELWEWIFSFPSHSRILGMLFFIPFPFPNYGNGFFIPFPLPNCGNGFFIPFPFPNLPFHRRESKRALEFCERYQTFNIFSFLYIFYNNLYWGGKMSLLVSDWKDREFCSVLLQIVMLQRC